MSTILDIQVYHPFYLKSKFLCLWVFFFLILWACVFKRLLLKCSACHIIVLKVQDLITITHISNLFLLGYLSCVYLLHSFPFLFVYSKFVNICVSKRVSVYKDFFLGVKGCICIQKGFLFHWRKNLEIIVSYYRTNIDVSV